MSTKALDPCLETGEVGEGPAVGKVEEPPPSVEKVEEGVDNVDEVIEKVEETVVKVLKQELKQRLKQKNLQLNRLSRQYPIKSTQRSWKVQISLEVSC